MTQQPKWKYVGNLGDRDPINHGGLFVFVDETGVYAPEAELLELVSGDIEDEYNDDDELVVEGDMKWEVRRFILEPCTFVDGILSDNPYHPDHPAWFAKPEAEKTNRPQDTTYLSRICDSMDVEADELIRLFCSNDPLERAMAWRYVGEYHGYDNLDSYPLEFDSLREVEKRYEGLKF